MADRISALASEYAVGQFGVGGDAGVTLCEVSNLTLYQVTAWPDTLSAVGTEAAKAVGVATVPGPGQAIAATAGAVLRIAPLTFWLVGIAAPQLEMTKGTTLDLSHSRTRLRVCGPKAAILLNRFIPLDLRECSFPEGSVASTALEHAGVTVWRSGAGFDLFVPRGFALSVWQVLLQGAAQFGCDIVVPR